MESFGETFKIEIIILLIMSRTPRSLSFYSNIYTRVIKVVHASRRCNKLNIICIFGTINNIRSQALGPNALRYRYKFLLYIIFYYGRLHDTYVPYTPRSWPVFISRVMSRGPSYFSSVYIYI